MAWHGYPKKNKVGLTWEYEASVVSIQDLASYMKEKATAKWQTKHFEPLYDGTVLIVSAQRSDFAPKKAKVKAAKKPKKEKTVEVETDELVAE